MLNSTTEVGLVFAAVLASTCMGVFELTVDAITLMEVSEPGIASLRCDSCGSTRLSRYGGAVGSTVIRRDEKGMLAEDASNDAVDGGRGGAMDSGVL